MPDKSWTFGTPVAATTFLPMTDSEMEADPGWFAPWIYQHPHDEDFLRDFPLTLD
jgi:hypothetical protein